MKRLFLCLSIIIITLGCAAPKTNLRKNERVTLVLSRPSQAVSPKAVPLIAGLTVAELGKHAAKIGAAILEREAKKYEATYSARQNMADAVAYSDVEDTKELSLKGVLTREALGDDGSIQELVTLEFVTASINRSPGYYQIQLQSLEINGYKAKSLSKEPKMGMTVIVRFMFPSEGAENGIVEYAHTFTFTVAGFEAIDVVKKAPASPFFPIPSTGPVTVQVDVLEYNDGKKWFERGAKALKKLGE